MGYESKVIIARKFNREQNDVLDILAELELSGMPVGFLNLFVTEWKTGYYDTASNTTIVKDKYGATVKYATFNKVYKWCLNNALLERYRRVDLLTAVLNSIRIGWADDIGQIIVIHYGY